MKNPKNNSGSSKQWLWGPALIATILIFLFWRSFLPGYVDFSNDGPLGQQNSVWRQLPAAFTGSWYDINVLGSSVGAISPNITTFLFMVLGPVGYSKFYPAAALLVLGLGAWYFFRALRLSHLAALLGGLAAALASTFFSRACWGIGAHPIAIGMDFFALGLIVSNTPQTPALTRWARLALAGMAVGLNVMEGADVGAIFSLFVAAFVFYKALNEEGIPVLKKIGGGILRTAMVAVFAGFIASQTILSLVGTQINGIVGTGQDAENKAQHWDFATQWSLPKKETLGLLVPGLFGYRMDTPKDMLPALQDAYQGGAYWGGMGRSPEIDRYLAGGSQGAPPPGIMRFNGDGNYLGILVALLAAFAIAQSLRRKNPLFTKTEKNFVWFWAVVGVLTLLLSWGRFAPLYQFFYALPYASTIRNPVKFLLVFSWATVILSGYGVHALSRRYLEAPATGTGSFSTQLINWWKKVRGFDRNWTVACAVAVAASALGWLFYSAQKSDLTRYLQTVGFDLDMAKNIASFSVGQAGWFILIFVLAAGLFTLVIAGIFSGKHAKLGGFLLGALLVVDLGRADLPFVIHQNYREKYELGSLNPILETLRNKPYENRVAALPFDTQQPLRSYDNYFGGNGGIYRIEWMQHHFPYYNIQCLDIIQMPRMPADLEAFETAIAYRNTEATTYLIPRRWQLTNTRYLLGPAGFLDVMNQQLDPGQHRFRIAQRFDIIPKPGVTKPAGLEELTATPSGDGDLALFEFTGALPRAKLFSSWQVSTNDAATLKTLADKNFDPLQTVLVSTPGKDLPAAATNQNSGTVEFKSYAPKDIVFDTQADTASVLLLNDKFDPDWRVIVDGKPVELLRCNFIMRGVYLPPGAHTVQFQFSLPNRPLYVTLAAIATGIFLLGLLVFLKRKSAAPR